MHANLHELDARPIDWLCRRAGAARLAAAATAALGAGLAAGAVDGRAAAACVAVAIVVGCDRAHVLLAERLDRSSPRPPLGILSRIVAAARTEGEDAFWLVRHAAGRTEGMTPSTFRRFLDAATRGLERLMMVTPGIGAAWNVEDGLPSVPPSLARRLSLQEASLRREAALSRLTLRPMPCTLLTAWDDTVLVETPASVDPDTGVVTPSAEPSGPGPMTQAYLAFENGGEYMLDRSRDGRFAVCDLANFLSDLAPAPAAA